MGGDFKVSSSLRAVSVKGGKQALLVIDLLAVANIVIRLNLYCLNVEMNSLPHLELSLNRLKVIFDLFNTGNDPIHIPKKNESSKTYLKIHTS